MQEEVGLSFLLKMVQNNFDRELNVRTAILELTASQCEVLGFLQMNLGREVNPSDIEKNFQLKKPTVTGILRRLTEKGFIDLAESKKDKRYKQIILTDKAMSYHIKMKKTLFETEEVLYHGITEEEKDALRKILEKMLRNLTEKGRICYD